ncbi:MAG: hypothetical protein ACI8Z1_002667 [Candidatus Azotimanducaceae bacterium]
MTNFYDNSFLSTVRRRAFELGFIFFFSFVISGCSGVPAAQDKPLLRPFEPAQNIEVEQTSDDIICVTVDFERTCVPVVHDEKEGER